MAFKDNLGVVEELKVEMVECCEPNCPEGEYVRVYALRGATVQIVWIDERGSILRTDNQTF